MAEKLLRDGWLRKGRHKNAFKERSVCLFKVYCETVSFMMNFHIPGNSYEDLHKL